MAFLKNMWKNNSRHKKLSEEWALATSLQDFSKNHDDFEEYEPTMFNVKYLGNTNVEAARSMETTAEAVKNIITLAKTNWKKLQRVALYISPKGIEMCDTLSGETLMQVSIYKISYCSADAAHNHVFAFINSVNDLDNESCPSSSESDGASSKDDALVLHAFLCQKRKIAQNVTLTVAKSFETAFQLWQDENDRRRRPSSNKMTIETYNKNSKTNKKPDLMLESDDTTMRSLLIDFNSELTAELCSKDHHKQYFQNTWVNFEDVDDTTTINEPLQIEVQKFQENLWDKNMIYS